jgi:hypothetical protein
VAEAYDGQVAAVYRANGRQQVEAITAIGECGVSFRRRHFQHNTGAVVGPAILNGSLRVDFMSIWVSAT